MKNDQIGIDEAAEILETTKPGIYGRVRRNEIPHSKKNGKLVFSREKLELMKDELIKGHIAKKPAFGAFMKYGEAIGMFEQIAVNFSKETQDAYVNFISKYASEVAQMVARDYKNENLNQN